MNISIIIVSIIFIISVIDLVQVSHGKNIENLNPGFHEISKNYHVGIIESKALTDSSIFKAIKSMVSDQNLPVSTIESTDGDKKPRVRRCALNILDNCRHFIEHKRDNAKDLHEHFHHCNCHVKHPYRPAEPPGQHVKHCHHCHCHVKHSDHHHHHAEPSGQRVKPTHKHCHCHVKHHAEPPGQHDKHCHCHVKDFDDKHHAEPPGRHVKHCHHCNCHVKHHHAEPPGQHDKHCHCHVKDSDDHFFNWLESTSHQDRKLERKKERCQKRVEYWKKKCESVK